VNAAPISAETEDGFFPSSVTVPSEVIVNEVEESSSVAALPQVQLPGGSQSVLAASEQLFNQLAITRRFFVKDGELCHIERDENGSLDLKSLSSVQFASEIERYVRLVKESDEGLVPTVITERQVKTMMASRKVRESLPAVRKVVRRPILSVAQGKVEILHHGYHPDHGGVLILSDETLSLIDPVEAAANILNILQGFCFASEADRGRAVALIMTIAMVEMGFLEGILRPMVMVMANFSQSGKSLLIHIACLLNEVMPLLLTKKGKGGVGSLDESIGHGFAAGGVLALDNMRGGFDSELLESAITARSNLMVRLPYQGNVPVKLDEVTVTGTSNGVQLTPDQLNRILFIHLKKDEERPEGSETEVELISRIKNQLPILRASIASLIANWWEAGRPSIHAPSCYRVEWSGFMNWIVQTQFGLPPLMDNHGQIENFLRSADREQIRNICIYIDVARQTGKELRAKEIIAILHDFVEEDADLLHIDHKKFGLLMRSLLRGASTLELDGWRITRTTKQDEPGSRGEPVHFWQFDHMRSLAVIAVEKAETPSEPLSSIISPEVSPPIPTEIQYPPDQGQVNQNPPHNTTILPSSERPRLKAALTFNS